MYYDSDSLRRWSRFNFDKEYDRIGKHCKRSRLTQVKERQTNDVLRRRCASRPCPQFQLQVNREFNRLLDDAGSVGRCFDHPLHFEACSLKAGKRQTLHLDEKLISDRHDPKIKHFDGDAAHVNAVKNVRNRWIQLGLWAKEWGDVDELNFTPFWGHEKVEEPQNPDGTAFSWDQHPRQFYRRGGGEQEGCSKENEATNRIGEAHRPPRDPNQFVDVWRPFGGNDAYPDLFPWEKRGLFYGGDLTVSDRKASRPLFQFQAQVRFEFEWIRDELFWEKPYLHVSFAELMDEAYYSVKSNWVKDGIWHEEWKKWPGTTWGHEMPLEDPMWPDKEDRLRVHAVYWAAEKNWPPNSPPKPANRPDVLHILQDDESLAQEYEPPDQDNEYPGQDVVSSQDNMVQDQDVATQPPRPNPNDTTIATEQIRRVIRANARDSASRNNHNNNMASREDFGATSKDEPKGKGKAPVLPALEEDVSADEQKVSSKTAKPGKAGAKGKGKAPLLTMEDEASFEDEPAPAPKKGKTAARPSTKGKGKGKAPAVVVLEEDVSSEEQKAPPQRPKPKRSRTKGKGKAALVDETASEIEQTPTKRKVMTRSRAKGKGKAGALHSADEVLSDDGHPAPNTTKGAKMAKPKGDGEGSLPQGVNEAPSRGRKRKGRSATAEADAGGETKRHKSS